MIINQRGGSITIDNTTEQEKVNISQRSGSNITMANHVTSELATNNKQTLVINDEYKTVWGSSNEFVGKKRIIRTGEDTLEIKGTLDEEQIFAYEQWKQTYSSIAMTNAQFAIERGGYGFPNGTAGPEAAGKTGSPAVAGTSITPKNGTAAPNPAALSKIIAVNNNLGDGSVKVPMGLRTYCNDSVAKFDGIQRFYCAAVAIDIEVDAFLGAKIGAGLGANFGAWANLQLGVCTPEGLLTLDLDTDQIADVNANVEVDIDAGLSVNAGVQVVIGAPANLKRNDSSEGGSWNLNQAVANLPNALLEVQKLLTPIEQKMGNGGDVISFTKRNNFAQIGAAFNDYPSCRIDEQGRSQPSSMFVGEQGAFGNFIPVPYIEEADNSSKFPCGNDDVTIGNRMTRTVGAGGISLKTGGTFELGGTKLKTGFKSINLNASHGIQIGSESFVEIQSLKCVTLKCNNQVYVDSSLGVKNNAIIGGGLYVEGELYCHHITAPAEVHKTQDTQVKGKFNATAPREVMIGECCIGGYFFPVFAMPTDNLITTYPHSHHHAGPAMKLIAANKDIRATAALNGMNSPTSIAQALPQVNEQKLPPEMAGNSAGGTGVTIGQSPGTIPGARTAALIGEELFVSELIGPNGITDTFTTTPAPFVSNVVSETNELTESGDTVL